MTDLIEWAAAGGYVRLFVDEGTAIAKLMTEARPVGATDDPGRPSRLPSWIRC